MINLLINQLGGITRTQSRDFPHFFLQHQFSVVGWRDGAVEKGRPEEVPVHPGPVVQDDQGGLIAANQIAAQGETQPQEDVQKTLEQLQKKKRSISDFSRF